MSGRNMQEGKVQRKMLDDGGELVKEEGISVQKILDEGGIFH